VTAAQLVVRLDKLRTELANLSRRAFGAQHYNASDLLRQAGALIERARDEVKVTQEGEGG